MNIKHLICFWHSCWFSCECSPGSQPSACDLSAVWATQQPSLPYYMYQYPIQVCRPAFGVNNQRMSVSVPVQLSAVPQMYQFSTVAQPAFVAQRPTIVNSAALYNQQLRSLPVSNSASGTLGLIPRPKKIHPHSAYIRTMGPLIGSNQAVGAHIASNQAIGTTQPSSSYQTLGSQAEHATMMGPQTTSNQIIGEPLAAANNRMTGSQLVGSDSTSWLKFVQQMSNQQQQAMFNPWNTEISRASDWGSGSNSFNAYAGEPLRMNKRNQDLDSKFSVRWFFRQYFHHFMYLSDILAVVAQSTIREYKL